jgi:hypothetical protein
VAALPHQICIKIRCNDALIYLIKEQKRALVIDATTQYQLDNGQCAPEQASGIVSPTSRQVAASFAGGKMLRAPAKQAEHDEELILRSYAVRSLVKH